MAKYGIEVKIDVTKLDKSQFYEGKKGKYVTLTTFVNTEDEDQYGNQGYVKQSAKDFNNKAFNEKAPIIGNTKIFWRDESSAPQPAQQSSSAPSSPEMEDGWDDDIPF